MTKTIQPGSTIGVLGSGQLGRMFTIAARRLGYRVHVLSPDDDTPTGQVADVEIQSSYDDLEAVAQFARGVDVMTFEFENVPAETIQVVDRFVRVRPTGHILHTTQQRDREKSFLSSVGIPVAPYKTINSLKELQEVATDQLPGVLKTAAWGYDGKGQARIDSSEDIESAWLALNTDLAILERLVDFELEFSIVAARGAEGEFKCYGPIINQHRNHVLDLSVAPSDLPARISQDAVAMTRTILEELEVMGVLCVEFFLTKDRKLLVNELAPRPHNSGHLTIDAHVTCQFEQQVRAVCGLPLGATTQLRPAAMANLMGEQWQDGQPQWSTACSLPDVKLHLYGKKDPRTGRKMGHITALAESSFDARAMALLARKLLAESPGSEAMAGLQSVLRQKAVRFASIPTNFRPIFHRRLRHGM